ncbi:MAG: acyl-CoA dehydrogenase family protein [Marivibrio sp.]|uniref:acyl-CoA dehydrogenase family protein n=1 Tax=Marivibrio sp. TaxID=2039719 RepID=UPI0032F01603
MQTETSVDPFADAHSALDALGRYVAGARAALAQAVIDPGGKPDLARLEAEQRRAHGFAWLAAHAEALAALQHWAERLDAVGRFGRAERLQHAIAFSEYLSRAAYGLPMGQSETVRPHDLGCPEAAGVLAGDPAVRRMIAAGGAPEVRADLAAALADGAWGDPGDDLADGGEDGALMRESFRRFAADHVAPHAQAWHKRDALIPESVLEALADLGLFGLTIPEAHGGLGLGKRAMCIVTEALSAAHLGVGSLGTRSEIAGDLIAQNGTAQQRARFLPGIASGACLPTAVFTEPDVGSDLAHLKTRAVRDGDRFLVRGAKTWITHGARSDLMTLLVRTNPDEAGHKGLSMLLAEKPRGSVDDPFPVAGLRGAEIRTLGYRGLKEYDIAFDDFAVPVENLLGGVEGAGFAQLMSTFESARIQTAARAVGTAAGALAAAVDYATTRRQFAKPLIAFPRVSDKLALIAAELQAVRQLTFAACDAKDSGRRSDVEAGMAKLLAARLAWAAADDGLQIHGGIGYAEDTPISRFLVDARILNIFEGAGEIQAQVIARGLLGRRN